MGIIRDCPKASEWDIWRANAVGRLLAAIPTLRTPPNPTIIPTNLFSLFKARGFCTFADFVRFLGIGQMSMCQWMHGKGMPSLASVLWLCAKLEISPVWFLTGAQKAENCTLQSCRLQMPTPGRKTRRRKDEYKSRLIESIKTARLGDSVGAIAQRAGMPKGQIHRSFPDLCKEIMERRRRFLSEKSDARSAEFRREILEAIAKLKEQNIEVKRRRVCDLLPKPRMIFSQWCNDILDQVMSKEGFS
jgi:transcriptional regulator with XRE-family HTH domain